MCTDLGTLTISICPVMTLFDPRHSPVLALVPYSSVIGVLLLTVCAFGRGVVKAVCWLPRLTVSWIALESYIYIHFLADAHYVHKLLGVMQAETVICTTKSQVPD